MSAPIIAGEFWYKPGVVDPASGMEMPGAEDIRLWIGRKGLLGKDAATRLALAAVRGLLDSIEEPPPAGTRTAVVVSNNFGNDATVRQGARDLAAGGFKALSALDAPTHSANIIASSIAIRHNWQGPCLSVCSGPAAGQQARLLAELLVTAGRADDVVLVGVEEALPEAVAGDDPCPAAAVALLVSGSRRPVDMAAVDEPFPEWHGARGLREPAGALR